MNIASDGIPKFFLLEMILQEGNPYVRDDTMFIKVIVDFGDMHKTLTPHALSFNPGLLTYIQQETEKRAPQLQKKTTANEVKLSCEESYE
jgi:hypothetical protein